MKLQCKFCAKVSLCVTYFQVPGLGHIPTIVKSMGSSDDGVVKSAIQVVHLLSANEVRKFVKA